MNYMIIVSQIQKEASSTGPSHAESTPQVINKTSLQNMNETLTPATFFANETNTSLINNNIPAEPTHSDTPIIQGEKSDTNRKHLRPLLLAKK
ncbi:6205_t:CDS:2 [Racocetra fulgida]|uniref:6205_t:CDS:1 n=1 Tax=Racocetra fulgida TaxID=60492 RepID=A0A9N9A5P5_9GLOM|nr:6205_t:CDS:2 [Racocetra fulgida]